MLDILYPAPEQQEPARTLERPMALDLLVTARCQAKCSFCFAPKDSLQEIAPQEWLRIIYLSSLNGVSKMIFTGGEPLLLDCLPNLLEYAKRLKLETTLSTNSLLLPQQHQRVMPYVDEIGIPIDGPNPERNAMMRQPNGEEQFASAIESIKLVQRLYPQVEITIRTVVSRLNFEFVMQIPKALQKFGIDLFQHEIRWKLYQFNPIGSQFTEFQMERLCVLTADFLSICADLRETKLRFEYFPVLVQDEIYLIVYPNGDLVTAVIDPQPKVSHGIPLFRYKTFGNLATNFGQAMTAWKNWREEIKRLGVRKVRIPEKGSAY